ncbi:hypothetical protein [Planctomicrobium sp. SH664]|uniref:hypothetical protein n=1 Tax=Planctomicrobium sp. SH664 TaxID=3448125 RepID=UPI003F5B5413
MDAESSANRPLSLHQLAISFAQKRQLLTAEWYFQAACRQDSSLNIRFDYADFLMSVGRMQSAYSLLLETWEAAKGRSCAEGRFQACRRLAEWHRLQNDQTQSQQFTQLAIAAALCVLDSDPTATIQLEAVVASLWVGGIDEGATSPLLSRLTNYPQRSVAARAALALARQSSGDDAVSALRSAIHHLRETGESGLLLDAYEQLTLHLCREERWDEAIAACRTAARHAHDSFLTQSAQRFEAHAAKLQHALNLLWSKADMN